MKYKTSELEGDRLDVAVAKAEGWAEQEVAAMLKAGDAADRYFSAASWGLAGPIIERERITLEWRDREEWWNNEQVSGPRWVRAHRVDRLRNLGRPP